MERRFKARGEAKRKIKKRNEEEKEKEGMDDGELTFKDLIDHGIDIYSKVGRIDALAMVAEVALNKHKQEKEGELAREQIEKRSLQDGVDFTHFVNGIDLDINKEQDKKMAGKKISNFDRTSKGVKCWSQSQKIPRKNVASSSGRSPSLPENFRKKIADMKGTAPVLLIEKRLFKSDLDESQSRLSMPIRKIKAVFLNESEDSKLGQNISIGVKIVDPRLVVNDMNFKRWKSNGLYVFNKNWKDFKVDNKLRVKDTIQIWSFRVGDDLCFAFVKATEQHHDDGDDDDDDDGDDADDTHGLDTGDGGACSSSHLGETGSTAKSNSEDH